MSIAVEICKEGMNEEWDSFVSNIEHGFYQQTSLWPLVKQTNTFNEKPVRVIIRDDQKIIAGFQMMIRNYQNIGRIGIIDHGPCIAKTDHKTCKLVALKINEIVHLEKLLYVTVNVPYNYHFLPKILKEAGFESAKKNFPPYQIIYCTLVLDLQKSTEELFADMDSRRKRNIRKGLKFNYQTRLGTREDIPLFFQLMTDACSRRNTVPTFNDIDYYYSIWDLFGSKGWVIIHIAEVNSKPVCAAFCFAFGDTFKFYWWGWNGEYADERITETFLWKNILWAKDNGFIYYENVELDKVSAEYIHSGGQIPEEIKTRRLFSVTYFKMRWGGKPVFYPGLYTFYRDNWIKTLLKIAFATILKESVIRTVKKIMLKAK